MYLRISNSFHHTMLLFGFSANSQKCFPSFIQMPMKHLEFCNYLISLSKLVSAIFSRSMENLIVMLASEDVEKRKRKKEMPKA